MRGKLGLPIGILVSLILFSTRILLAPFLRRGRSPMMVAEVPPELSFKIVCFVHLAKGSFFSRPFHFDLLFL